MTVKELIKRLETMPQDKSVICQVIAKDGTVWNMFFEVEDVPSSKSLVVLEVSHPDLGTLANQDELRKLRDSAHSACYLLEDLNDYGWGEIERITGLPEGVIISARQNILANAKVRDGESGPYETE